MRVGGGVEELRGAVFEYCGVLVRWVDVDVA